MNKLATLCWIAVVIVSCHTKAKPQPSASEVKFRGLLIDSSIKKRVDSIVVKNLQFANVQLATLEIKAFENDKPVDRPLFTGKAMPCISMYFYDDTSMFISLIPGIMGRTGAFAIIKTRDSCSVQYAFSLHERSVGPYKLHANDSLTRPGLQVPCKFTVILNQASYKNGEPIYGYVEAISDDHYIRIDSTDIKARVEFKGYFKAIDVRRETNNNQGVSQ